MNFTDTIMVLGAGQIGLSVIQRLIDIGYKRIILHTVTKCESERALTRLAYDHGNVNIEIAYGDLFSPSDIDTITTNKEHCQYLSLSESELPAHSMLYKLCAQYLPDYIIDAINTATVLGEQKEALSVERLSNLSREELMKEYILAQRHDIIRILTQYIKSLKRSMLDYNVRKYIKISTTGLGGMGLNIPFTHGDVHSGFLSDALLGKVSASGILHQMLWSLSHTPGYNVSVVVPAACVGFDKIGYSEVINHNGTVKRITDSLPLNWNQDCPGTVREMSDGQDVKAYMVYAGENLSYTMDEVVLLTSDGLMESITKEEVAQAVVDCLLQKSQCDLLATMDTAMLRSTYNGSHRRNQVIDELKSHKKNPLQDVATGNLGPTVTKHLFEMSVLLESCHYDLKLLIQRNLNETVHLCNEIIQQNVEFREYILSIGLPVVLESRQYYMCGQTSWPILSFDCADDNIRALWVDLRFAQIQYYITAMTQIYNNEISAKQRQSYNQATTEYLFDNQSPTAGSCVAAIYLMEGRGRIQSMS